MTQQQFITTRELCEELGLSLPSVYKALEEGKIPGVQLGRRWVIRREWFDEWVSEVAKGHRPAAEVTKELVAAPQE